MSGETLQQSQREAIVSHTTDWTCRSCRAVLGQVHNAVLHPIVTVRSIDRQGLARVPCPRCGRVRDWVPSVATADRQEGSSSAMPRG